MRLSKTGAGVLLNHTFTARFPFLEMEVVMKTQRWQDWVMLILGAWLFFSPFWMNGYASTGSAAAWNSYIFGVVAVVLAVAALTTGQRWEEWVELILGIWLIVAPFFLSFYNTEHSAAWNQIIVGVLIAADAIWVLAATQGERMRI